MIGYRVNIAELGTLITTLDDGPHEGRDISRALDGS